MKPDLEVDLIKSDYIANKCIGNDVYSQNLYAALCNNRFFKGALDEGGISYEQEWTCSWRYAGGILADLRDCNEDYMVFYCSGIGNFVVLNGLYNNAKSIEGYLSEGTVSEEIRKDLGELGWTIKPYEPRLQP